MTKNDFINQFKEALELSDATKLNPDTLFKDLEDWDSLAALTVIAMFDEEFSIKITGKDLANIETLDEMYNLTKV